MKINTILELIKQNAIEKGYNVYDVAICTRSNKPKVIDINHFDGLPNSYSVAKAFSVCAIGFLYDEGKIDLEEPITNILKKHLTYPYNPIWDTITVHNTLKHRLGIQEGFLDIDCNDPKSFGDDYLRYVMQTEFIYEPKKNFIYTDAAYYLISRIVYIKSGMDINDYLKEKLYKELNITEVKWTSCPYGYSMGGTGLYMKTIDTLKLPTLYLNNGVWEGKRLLSEEWMSLLEKHQYENYYTEENGWFQKGGMLAQMVMYNKRLNCAISWHGNSREGANIRQFVFDSLTEELED